MASYERQKKTAFAHLRVNSADLSSLTSGQFTVFDFLEHSFAFSPKRRQLAADVLELVRQKPRRFKDLLYESKSQKSALHGVLSALSNSGLLEEDEKREYRLCPTFCAVLRGYSFFWENWSKTEKT